MALEIKSWLGKAQNCDRVKLVEGILILPLLIIGSPMTIHYTDTMYKQTIEKPAQIHFYTKSKRPHTITKMNDNINMDSTFSRVSIRLFFN